MSVRAGSVTRRERLTSRSRRDSAPGSYGDRDPVPAVCPIWLVGNEPDQLQFVVTFDPAQPLVPVGPPCAGCGTRRCLTQRSSSGAATPVVCRSCQPVCLCRIHPPAYDLELFPGADRPARLPTERRPGRCQRAHAAARVTGVGRREARGALRPLNTTPIFTPWRRGSRTSSEPAEARRVTSGFLGRVLHASAMLVVP